MSNRTPVFAVIRDMLGRGLTQPEVDKLDRAFDVTEGKVPPQIGLIPADFQNAAILLNCKVSQIRAVWEVESGGGWFTDVRADILALDGPGGFLDGPNLPKILFEAHHFSRMTGGKYNREYPNISSSTWKRSLYVGGVGEYARLHRAILLNREAALMSASVGGAQIMGFNYKLAGYGSVEAFWADMKISERYHLDAFAKFIINSGLQSALRMISTFHADCEDFASKYNGPSFALNDYHIKIAKAYKKWSELP